MTPILAASILEPTAGLIVWKALTFGLLLYLLYRFAWKPITSAMAEREETIDASIKRAERALEQAQKIQADNERARREAEQEAQRILRETREETERLRSEEMQKTRERVQHLLDQARTEIEREKQGALEELRAEVADLAIQAASKIIQENLDDQRQRRLVEEFISDLPSNSN